MSGISWQQVFPMKLKDWLYKSKISVKDFAQLLGIHRCYLHILIGGRKSPSDELMDRISSVTLNKVATRKDIIERKR